MVVVLSPKRHVRLRSVTECGLDAPPKPRQRPSLVRSTTRRCAAVSLPKSPRSRPPPKYVPHAARPRVRPRMRSRVIPPQTIMHVCAMVHSHLQVSRVRASLHRPARMRSRRAVAACFGVSMPAAYACTNGILVAAVRRRDSNGGTLASRPRRLLGVLRVVGVLDLSEEHPCWPCGECAP